MSKSGKSVLVVGEIGTLAEDVVSCLAKKYPDYHILNLKKDSICDAEEVRRVIREHHVDTILHLVQSSPFEGPLWESLQYTRQAVYGTHVLLEEGHRAGVKRFLHFSSTPPCHSCQKAGGRVPNTLQVASQAGAEHMVLSYWWSYQFPVIVARHTDKRHCHMQLTNKQEHEHDEEVKSSDNINSHHHDNQNAASNRDRAAAAACDVLLHQGVAGQAYHIDADGCVSPAEPIPQPLLPTMCSAQNEEKICPNMSTVDGLQMSNPNEGAS